MPRTLLYKTPAPRDQKCFFCLEDIEIGDGAKAHFGIGNTRPFHKTCLKMLLPHIGIVTFDSQRNMYVKIEKCDNVKNGEEVTYMTRRVVMGGGRRLEILHAFINRIPLDDSYFEKKGRKKGTSVKRKKVEKNVKEVISI